MNPRRIDYEFTHLSVTVQDGIAVVRYEPRDEGELEDSVFANARDVMIPLGYDASVRGVVLTGTGEVFFGGAGRPRAARLVRSPIDVVAGQFELLKQLTAAIVSFRKPLVAAVNGDCRNIGAQIALLCDAAVATQDAVFSDDHIAHGLAAGDGGTVLWPLLVGLARAREILLLGGSLTAQEAREMHLVASVVPAEQVVAEARELAGRLAEIAPLAYYATKAALNNWWRLSSSLSWDMALAYEAAGLVAPEFVSKLTP
jgi:enoyl-CoA hydratase